MSAPYDVFLSHAWADGDRPQQIAEALTGVGLRVWFDAVEINDFASITRAVTEGLARSKALLAYYSKTYPWRRACQWELTAAFLAAQAEGDPRRRVLVVNPEEKADHIHPIELRDAKFRSAPRNDGAALRELAQSIVRQVRMLDGPLADIHPLSAPNWYGVSPVGSTRFVGRMKEMWQVHSLLHAGDAAQVSYASAATGGIGRISGLGGVGKSLLAEEYGLHFGSAYPGGVFWLRANGDTQTDLNSEQREALRKEQFRQIAALLGMTTQEMKKEEQVEGALKQIIGANRKPCLWVVDDVPTSLNGQALRRWFAPNALARTLITTRSGEYGSITKGIELSVFAQQEAYQLLISRKVPLDKDEVKQAQLLAEDLGYHALALDVTASALKYSAAVRPFGDYRTKLARTDKDSLLFAEGLADALPNGHEKSIAQTMLRSIRGVGAEGQDFLRLASTLAVAPIPVPLVTAVFTRSDALSQEEAEERTSLALKQVTVPSLAELDVDHQEARVHTLVSRAIRYSDPTPARTKALRKAVAGVLATQLAKVAHEQQPGGLAHQVQHVRAVTLLIADDRSALDQDEARSLLRLMAYLDRHDEKLYLNFRYARELRQKVFAISQSVLGEQDFDTVTVMNDLAVLLWVSGDLVEARVLQEKAVRLCRLLRGDENIDTLTAMMNLRDTLVSQGDQPRALELQRRINEIGPRVWATGTTGVLRHNPP